MTEESKNEDALNDSVLSQYAIKFLLSQKIEPDTEKTIEEEFIFQIDHITKNELLKNYTICTLIDNDSKYAGFFINYINNKTPKVGDIIRTKTITISFVSEANFKIFKCNEVILLDNKELNIKNINDFSLEKILHINKNESKGSKNSINSQNSKNSLENNDDINLENVNVEEQNLNPEPTLIKNINSLVNDPFLQLKCIGKSEITNYEKYNKKGIHQKYTFCDIESSFITAVSFNDDTLELDKKIKKGLIFNIRGAYIKKLPFKIVKLSEKCSIYQLTLKKTTEIELVNDIDRKIFFQKQIKIKIVNIQKIINLPLRTYVKFVGIILRDSGIINYKNSVNRKLIIGDTTLYKIEVSLWNKYTNTVDFKVGDVIMFNKLTVREYRCAKLLHSIDNCSEITKDDIPKKIIEELTEFYLKHNNYEEYTDINDKQETINSKKIFIKQLSKIGNINSNENNNNVVLKITGKIVELIPAKNINDFYCFGCFNVSQNAICKKCNLPLKPFFRFLLKIQDCSGFMWIEIYGYLAESFLNIKITDYQYNILNNAKRLKEFFEKIREKKLYKTYSFIGKKRENDERIINKINEEYKIIFSVYKILEINKEHYHQLLKIIKGES